jgi:cytochrome c oxidase subunit 3
MADYTGLKAPYSEAGQQHDAGMMGMYLFIATEVMLFGGLFATAFVLRWMHPADFVAASKQLHLWIGGINTAILLTSSLLVAIAVRAGREGSAKTAVPALLGGGLLGLGFLGMKAYEYSLEFNDGLLPAISYPTRFATPAAHQFMDFYLISTGLHAFHLTVGVLLLLTLAWRIRRQSLRLPGRAVVVEAVGIYWHFVDVVWIFLYPVLYLAR